MSRNGEKQQNFTPRSYQLELLSKAKKKNTIAFLNTGTGKTYISILLIMDKSEEIRISWEKGGKRTFFIVNSVPLVHQQGNYIREFTSLRVGLFTGSMAVDLWTSDEWSQQFIKYEVLVMTAQIFLNILNHGFLKLSRVNLIVFDECHHAIKNHPYKKIMELVMDESFCVPANRPHILGLTASVINKKCDHSKIDDNIKRLELTMNSSVETTENRVDINKYNNRPKELVYVYQTVTHAFYGWINEYIIAMLKKGLVNFYPPTITNNDAVQKKKFIEDFRLLKSNKFTLHITILNYLINIANSYGPWCALMAAKIFARDACDIQSRTDDIDMVNAYSNVISFINNVVIKMNAIVKRKLSMRELLLLSTGKLQTLIQILQTYSTKIQENQSSEEGHRFTAIVFVQTRFTAILLNLYISMVAKLSDKLSFLKPGYIIGHGVQTNKKVCKSSIMLHKMQEDVLNRFRHGELNILIGTTVIEEGIDIPKCNLVIRFDPPNNFRSYVQSRGRARAEGSYYLIMIADKFRKSMFADLRQYARIEKGLTTECFNRAGPAPEDSMTFHKIDQMVAPYQPILGEGKPRVTLTSAISLVNWYCSRLPSDAYTKLYPICKTKVVEIVQTYNDGGVDNNVKLTKFQTTLKLPINSVLKAPIIGEPMDSPKLAQMAAALKACELLHKAGELNDHLLPLNKDAYVVEREELQELVKSGSPLPGTTKRKQLYHKRFSQSLQNAMPIPNEPCYMYEIQMNLNHPTPQILNTHGRRLYRPEKYSKNLAILTKNPLSTIPQFPIYTRAGEVHVKKFLLSDKLILKESQIEMIKSFHHYMIKNVLRLDSKNMMFEAENSPYNFLITIVDRTTKNDNHHIDYKFMEYVFAKEKEPLPDLSNPSRPKFLFQQNDFIDAVVSPLYRQSDRPMYYFVAEIMKDMTPKSVFPKNSVMRMMDRGTLDDKKIEIAENGDAENESGQLTESNETTFLNYYFNRYGIQLTNDTQNLLDVDHTVGRLNLLAPRFMTKQGTFLPASSDKTKRSKRDDINQKQILVPELCRIHPFPTPLWHKTVCIPAIVHRINYLLICDEIRQKLANNALLGPADLDEVRGDEFPKLDFGWKRLCEIYLAGEITHNEEINEFNDGEENNQDVKNENLDSEENDAKVSTDLLDHMVREITSVNDLDQNETTYEYANGDTVNQIKQEKMDINNDDVPLLHKTNSMQQFEAYPTQIAEKAAPKVVHVKPYQPFNDENASQIDIVQEPKPDPEKLGNKLIKQNSLSDTTKTSKTNGDVSYDELERGKALNNNQLPIKKTNASRTLIDFDKMTTFDIDSYLKWEETDYKYVNAQLQTSDDGYVLTDQIDNVYKNIEFFHPKSHVPFTPLNHPLCSLDENGDLIMDNPFSPPQIDQELSNDSTSSNVMQKDKNFIANNEPNTNYRTILEDDGDYMTPEEEKGILNVSEPISTLQEAEYEDGYLSDECYYSPSTSPPPEIAEIIKDLEQDYAPSSTIIDEKTEPEAIDINVSFMPAFISEIKSYKVQHKTLDSIFIDKEEKNQNMEEGELSKVLDVLDPFNFNQEDEEPKKSEPLPYYERDVRHAVTTIDPNTKQRVIIPNCPDIGLLLRAITMSTSNDAFDLERLELIGDSFLKMAVTVYLFCSEPDSHEGKLSYKRSKQVSNFKLYHLGKIRGFGEILVSTKFEPVDNWLPPGYVSKHAEQKACYKSEISKIYDMKTEHYLSDKCIADCVEAFIGAYLISCGSLAALAFMRWMGIHILLGEREWQVSQDLKSSPKHALNESWYDHDIDDLWSKVTGKLPPISPLILSTPNHNRKLLKVFANLERFQDVIGYKFKDPSFLIQAFTHSSYSLHRLTDCYQRLEFLGDALLDYLITRHLYTLSDRFTPGQMTDLRSALVNNIIFASLAVKFGFHKYLLSCSTKLFATIDKFVKVQREKTLIGKRLKKSGDNLDETDFFPMLDTFNMGDNLLIWANYNRDDEWYSKRMKNLDPTVNGVNENGTMMFKDIEVPKVLGDIFESVAGAIFMDSGMSLKTLWRVYSSLMSDAITYYTKHIPMSPIRELLESEPDRVRFMKPVKMKSHYKVCVEILGKGKWIGLGSNAKIAKCTAAKTALAGIKGNINMK